MTAPLPTIATADPMAGVRVLNRLLRDGFTLRVSGDALQVAPIARLSDEQRATIRAHKSALLALLQDAETLLENLTLHGPAGLGWMEGTPDWTGERLLAAGEVLYADGRMVNRHERRYLKEHAPTGAPEAPETADSLANVAPFDREAYEERAAILEYDGGLPRDVAERRAKGRRLV